MNASSSPHPVPGPREHALTVTRTADTQWQALDGDLVVGRADASNRPDGRLFVSIDAWHDAARDRLAATMLADLPAPLHTVADEADHDAVAAWQRLGFTTARRERTYVVPTDPHTTGLAPARPPAGVTIVPAGQAQEGPLHDLDRAVRDEVGAGPGWRTMPAEVLPRPAGTTVVDPSKYVVAQQDGRYLGLLRLAPVTRRPRIGLIAVRAEAQRRGIARALLAHTLGSLHHAGTASAWAEADETNTAAIALLEGVGAEHVGSILELVRR
ncbi:GNAT family N-acetyltransferase [Kitasatospora sp. NPDC057904]|uniref:GNAT family N-acetyltransferase n=1 Tax=unclassified Kitasatospora TaxID=2633591 RepID=UPI0036D9F4B0